MARSRMFEYTKLMNCAFGNSEGNPADYTAPGNDTAWARLQKQCENIGGALSTGGDIVSHVHGTYTGGEIAGEVLELLLAIQARDIVKVRDSLCDIMVFALGGFHIAGFDADADMEAVLDGVMTRFCRDQEELDATVAHWADKGVQHVYTEGVFPRMCVKVSFDQVSNTGERFPRGKFLKSVGYKEPKLPEYPTPMSTTPPPVWAGPAVAPARRLSDNTEAYRKD